LVGCCGEKMKKKTSPQIGSENRLTREGAVSPEGVSSELNLLDGNDRCRSDIEKSVDEFDISETEDMLVDSIDELSSAFAEIKYAKQRDLLNRNMDEIKEMIKSVEFQLNVILRELEEVK